MFRHWSRCTLAACTPKAPCKVHARPLDQLRQPGVTFYTARVHGALAAMGAVKHLDSAHGELKSMRAAPEWRGKGVGEAMLVHLLGVARARGCPRMSLETGRTEAFAPAAAFVPEVWA